MKKLFGFMALAVFAAGWTSECRGQAEEGSGPSGPYVTPAYNEEGGGLYVTPAYGGDAGPQASIPYGATSGGGGSGPGGGRRFTGLSGAYTTPAFSGLGLGFVGTTTPIQPRTRAKSAASATVSGQQGTNTVAGPQGSGTTPGPQSSEPAIGQQGSGTAVGPQTGEPAIGQPATTSTNLPEGGTVVPERGRPVFGQPVTPLGSGVAGTNRVGKP